MTIKSLLLCLFLYVCLAWVGAALLHPEDILHYGLLWTAIGLIAVLVFIIVARLFGWWRLWRAKAAARPAAAPKPAASLHPDDEAMAALLAEANSALVKAPSFAGTRTKAPLSTLPLYLLVGPEGSGKTSTFLNSGLEAQLLAGQGVTPVVPTRLGNFWLAKNAIFAEIGGRAFAGDLTRWSQLLATLGRRVTLPFWRRLWGETEEQVDLRGVIAFCDSKEFTGAASDPQRLERYSRDWQERLRSIAEQFGAEFPVYVVITRCDKIPFFTDFFRRLPESENNQVLGCTLPAHKPEGSSTGEVFVEAEAKRLTASFRPLYHALARRRLAHLAHEPNPAYRPGVYEFPRELKRIRSPLVQFLTDVFRPYSLGPTPLLRGYYLTGVRETEVGVNEAAARPADSHPPMEATRLFRGDATQIFQGDDLTKGPSPAGRRALGLRWIFVADLFHKVLLPDQSRRKVPRKDSPVERYRKLVLGAVCGLSALLCLAFLVSWIQNRELLSEVATIANSQPDRQGRETTLADLDSLDRLRGEIVRLEGHLPWSYHWGLYSGDPALAQARAVYFRQFKRLLLNDINGLMVSDLGGLPNSPGEDALYEPVHRLLKGYLMITTGSCTVESPFVSQLLKEERGRIAPGATVEWQARADSQIDFYATELAQGNPWHLPEDANGRDRARQYLRQAKGIDRIYSSIRAAAEKSLAKGKRLSESAANYTQVLSGPDEVSPLFSREGWSYVEKASKETPAIGEPCVLGGAAATVSDWKQSAETAQAIQRMYFKDYVEAWRKFVAGFSVTKYSSAADAARKLDILADHNSPLLAMLAMTAKNTNFAAPAAPSDAGVVEKGISKGLAILKGAETKAKAVAGPPAEAPEGPNSPADITPFFQPVDWVEPPASETWVNEKNQAYMDALGQLRNSMQAIAQGAGSPPDAAVHQAASQNADKALDAVQQIAKGFKPIGVGGLDVTVEGLLKAPIQFANNFILRDVNKVPVSMANQGLRSFCASASKTLRKYPFQAASNDDATLEEFTGLFEPSRGALWKFALQSLGDFVVKDGAQWKAKDPSKKPQVTSEVLGFLNRGQAIADVFYAAGGPAQFSYTLRPKLDSRLKESTLELEIDGKPFQWTTSLQHQFSWPSPPGSKDAGAVARLRTGAIVFSFASRGGTWGIFRIMGDAEPRDLNNGTVEWRYTTGGAGRKERIEPAPVDLEIVRFPGGQDVFNPKFWEGLRCPPTAVQ